MVERISGSGEINRRKVKVLKPYWSFGPFLPVFPRSAQQNAVVTLRLVARYCMVNTSACINCYKQFSILGGMRYPEMVP